MSLIVVEFRCESHGRTAMTFARDAVPDNILCPTCGEVAPYVISAPMGRVRIAEVSQGKVAEKPHPLAVDTQPLADGMPLKEWKAKRRELWQNERFKQIKKELG